MYNATFQNALLEYVDFRAARFGGFQDEINDAMFLGADLRYADFRGADIPEDEYGGFIKAVRESENWFSALYSSELRRFESNAEGDPFLCGRAYFVVLRSSEDNDGSLEEILGHTAEDVKENEFQQYIQNLPLDESGKIPLDCFDFRTFQGSGYFKDRQGKQELFKDANFKHAVLEGINLSNTNLENAILEGTNLTHANLTDAIFGGIDQLSKVKGGRFAAYSKELRSQLCNNPSIIGGKPFFVIHNSIVNEPANSSPQILKYNPVLGHILGENSFNQKQLDSYIEGLLEHDSPDFKCYDFWQLREVGSPRIFEGKELENADFSLSNLNQVNFQGSTLSNVNFNQAVLISSRFIEALISGHTKFNGADLRRTDFSGATFKLDQSSITMFEDAKIKYANFKDVNLSSSEAKVSFKNALSLAYSAADGPDGSKPWLHSAFSPDLRKELFCGDDERPYFLFYNASEPSKLTNDPQKTNRSALESNIVGLSEETGRIRLNCFRFSKFSNSDLFSGYQGESILFENIDFSRSNLNSVNLSANDFVDVDFQEASLDYANLSGSRFQAVKLANAKVRRTIFSNSEFEGDIDFSEADLRVAKFTQAVFEGNVNFTEADLRDTDFTQSLFVGQANFSRADLRKANLSGADFSGVDLTEANLTGANLTGTTVSRTLITQEQIDQTVNPEGINLIPQG